MESGSSLGHPLALASLQAPGPEWPVCWWGQENRPFWDPFPYGPVALPYHPSASVSWVACIRGLSHRAGAPVPHRPSSYVSVKCAFSALCSSAWPCFMLWKRPCYWGRWAFIKRLISATQCFKFQGLSFIDCHISNNLGGRRGEEEGGTVGYM